MAFYDWEANVVGPDGKPAAQSATPNQTVEGNPTFELSHYAAVLRAAQRPVQVRRNATTNGTWYIVDDKAKKVVAGPEETRTNLFAEGRRLGPGERVVEVKEGTVVVQAEAPTGGRAPDLWYVLNDDPALKGTDIKNPQQTYDQQTGEPIVTFDFTSHGATVWQNVTRQIAQRGQAVGVNQHFAIVLDNQLISVPYIDFNQNPDGIDASNGSQIQGGFTIDSAQRLANLLKFASSGLGGLSLVSVTYP